MAGTNAELYADKLVRGARAGFRAKISKHWYVFQRGKQLPIDGPFPTKGKARRAINAHRHKGDVMDKTEKTTKETTEKTAKGLDGKTRDYTRTAGDGTVETQTFPRSEHHQRKAEGWTPVDADDADDDAGSASGSGS